MPLTRLAEFYDRIPDAGPDHHQRRAVRWLIDLADDGRFLGLVDTTGDDRRAKEFVVPYRRRTAPGTPYLLADRPDYVLGIGDGADVAGNQAAFCELVAECAEATGEDDVTTVYLFLTNEVETARLAAPEAMKPNDTLTFRVAGRLVTESPEVRAFWQALQSGGDDDEAQALVAECLLCGELRPVLKRHPVELRLGKDRVQIIAADKDSFASYGLHNSEIAPICLPCALRYGQAARYLMTTKEHHYQAGGMHYVYWTRTGGHGGLFSLLQDPQPEQVEALLRAPFQSRAAPAVDDEAFYAFSATVNTARLVMRDWLATTVGEVEQHLRRWFTAQDLVGPRGEPSEPIGLYALAGSLVRKIDDLPPQALPALVGAALFGRPLPVWLLHQAIRRCHAEQQLTRPRAALVKMVLNSVPESERRVPLMTASLDLDNREPAYLCGRLFALLEAAQRRAIPGINATIADRFFGTAGSAPASVFPRLMRGAKTHLNKLAGVESTRGAAFGIERRIEEVAAGLSGFPTVLSMVEQGLFLLGYYHQRAADRAAAAEHKQAGEADPDADQSGPPARA